MTWDVNIKSIGGCLKLYKNENLLFTGFKRSILYILPAVCVAGFSGIASYESDSEATKKWHLRLEHMSQKGLDILGQRGLFGKTRISILNFCEP